MSIKKKIEFENIQSFCAVWTKYTNWGICRAVLIQMRGIVVLGVAIKGRIWGLMEEGRIAGIPYFPRLKIELCQN
jgi:hypothetical protein